MSEYANKSFENPKWIMKNVIFLFTLWKTIIFLFGSNSGFAIIHSKGFDKVLFVFEFCVYYRLESILSNGDIFENDIPQHRWLFEL